MTIFYTLKAQLYIAFIKDALSNFCIISASSFKWCSRAKSGPRFCVLRHQIVYYVIKLCTTSSISYNKLNPANNLYNLYTYTLWKSYDMYDMLLCLRSWSASLMMSLVLTCFLLWMLCFSNIFVSSVNIYAFWMMGHSQQLFGRIRFLQIHFQSFIWVFLELLQ